MKKQTKRICMAVTNVEFCGSVNQIDICGLTPNDKPEPLYVPLCAAHRVVAGLEAIKVLTGGEIADYRL